MKGKRIGWVDTCRGLLIILMVIGHSTGLFNKYIYQFHMAAFFFLSGYVAHPEKKSFFQTLFDKFLTVLLPTLTITLFSFFILWLLNLGNYDALLSASVFPGWKQALTSLLAYGVIYVDVLGACWFLITLFGICILNKLIHMLAGGSLVGYLSMSLLSYMAGYGLVLAEVTPAPHIGMFSIDLILIGNLFYAAGYCVRETGISEWFITHKAAWGISLVISMICTWLISHYLHIIIDWPSRTFSHPVLDGATALNGVILISAVSLIIDYYGKRIVKLLCYVGKNTMGIVFFHFSFFKVMYLPFYIGGLIGKDDLSCITPGRMSTLTLERRYWIIIAVGAIVISLVVWNLLLQSKVMCFLLGQNKQAYTSIWNTLIHLEAINMMAEKIHSFTGRTAKMWRHAKAVCEKNRGLGVSTALLLLLAVIPLYKQGIMCNDELISRLWSMKGLSQFLNHYAINDYVMKGRALSALIDPLCMYMGFMGNSNWTFRILQILSILLDAVMFSVLLFKLFRNKRFAGVCGLSIIVFLPVTFEHTAPNAFNTLFNIPFLLLLISLILFTNYLDTEKKSQLVISMLLLFVNLLSYESFIMLTPLYWGIVIGKKGIKDKKQILNKIFYPAFVALVFIVCYLISGMIFRSSYPGNQIGGFTIQSSVKIILQLISASFPGYYLFVSKYRYLFSLYYSLELENYVRILLTGILFGGIVYYLGAGEYKSPDGKHDWGAFGMSILCIVLPACPIAAAQMYQGHVGVDGFIALPTTFFTYFAATFICWYIVWQLLRHFHNRKILLLTAVGIACYLVPVQAMNDVFAKQQNKDFQRLLAMESLFSSDLLDFFEGREIKSTDYFTTQNSLAIHDSYWTEFAAVKGRHIQISNIPETEDDICLYFTGNEFTLRCRNEICIITPQIRSGYDICKYAEEKYSTVLFEDPEEDNGLYEYFYTLSDTGELVSSNKETFMSGLVGNTLQSCLKEYGYYEDGWVGRNSRFLIRTGEEGVIEIETYCPLEDFKDREIAVYVEDILIEIINVQDATQKFTVYTEPNQVVKLELTTNFVQESTPGDLRELAIIILSMQGY